MFNSPVQMYQTLFCLN